MNNDEFLKRLSEVSEWTRPQVGPNGAASVTKRVKSTEPPPQYTQEELDAMTDDEVQEVYDNMIAWRERQPNDSIRPVVIKLKIQNTSCGDCGLDCPSGRKEEAKLCLTNNPHWRHRCMSCGLYKNPVTGKFELDSKEVHTFLGNHYKSQLAVDQVSEPKKSKVAQDQGRARLKAMLDQRQRRAKEKEMAALREQQYQMVAYDNGDSIVYHREPIPKVQSQD